MPYNLSDNAFNQVKEILEELLELKAGDIWKQSFQDNHKAARMIRQGMQYCVINEDKVGKRFAQLKQNIRIRATNDYVLAERKFAALEPLTKVVERSKSFPGLSTFNQVVTAFLANKHLTELWFPDLQGIEVNLLSKIADAHGFKVAVSDHNKAVGIYKTHRVDNAEPRNEKEHTD